MHRERGYGIKLSIICLLPVAIGQDTWGKKAKGKRCHMCASCLAPIPRGKSLRDEEKDVSFLLGKGSITERSLIDLEKDRKSGD